MRKRGVYYGRFNINYVYRIFNVNGYAVVYRFKEDFTQIALITT